MTRVLMALLLLAPLTSRASGQDAVELGRSALELAEAGKLEEAEAAFGELEKRGPLNPTQLDRALDVSTRLNHWDRVVELLVNARKTGTLSLQRRLKLYEARLRQGNPAEAERELRAVLSERPDDESLIHLLAFLLLSQDRFQEGADLYRNYIETHPAAVESRVNLALVDFKLNRVGEALAQLKKAFDSDPAKANEFFYRQLVRNMAPEGLAELARDTKRELGLPEDGARAHLLLGREFESLARSRNAIEEYEKYLAAQPDDLDALYHLARLYFQAGEGERCRQALGRLLQEAGSIGDSARFLAAELAVKSDRLEEAAGFLKNLPSSYRGSALYQMLAARVALGEGDLQNAERLLSAVLKSDPDMAEAYFYLGQVYVRQGRTDKGREAMAEFRRRKKP